MKWAFIAWQQMQQILVVYIIPQLLDAVQLQAVSTSPLGDAQGKCSMTSTQGK